MFRGYQETFTYAFASNKEFDNFMQIFIESLLNSFVVSCTSKVPAAVGEYESAVGINAQTREHAALLKALVSCT